MPTISVDFLAAISKPAGKDQGFTKLLKQTTTLAGLRKAGAGESYPSCESESSAGGLGGIIDLAVSSAKEDAGHAAAAPAPTYAAVSTRVASGKKQATASISVAASDGPVHSAVVIIRTSAGGWKVGTVSGMDLPIDIEEEIRKSDTETLMSSLVAKLVSRGYCIASQTSAGLPAGAGPEVVPELVYTLTGPGNDYGTSDNKDFLFTPAPPSKLQRLKSEHIGFL